MISLADSLVSAASRPLAIKRRTDLTARRQYYLGTSYWIVKEPVGLNYFRFQEEEYAILNMLDGRTSLDEIKDRYEAEFPPGKISVEEIARFVGNLYQSGLLVADVAGQGDQLKKAGGQKRRKQIIGAFSNVLAVRFKGIDPDRFLIWLYPKVRWFFTKTALAICLTMAAIALLLVTIQWETFQSKLPAFHEFFASKNWIWLMITLGVTKILHEFGHGLACKHFGGECHEIGVMILVLTPCLYCNVSDSWLLPNKWHRAAIGAAGMFVEVVIASLCTFVWWFSEPGLLNQVALSVMFVSSVSTILFNGNPLLRFDGYYILADIMEIPNLRQKATSILGRKLGKWCLGLEEPDDPFLPQRNQWAFALYTIAAVVYRWLVVIMILLFLYKVFEPYGLQIIGQIIMVGSLYGLLVQPMWKLGKYLSVPGRMHKVSRPRMYTTLGVIAAVLALVFFVPLPYRVVCPLEVQLQNARAVTVTVPGVLKDVTVEPGTWVDEGTKIAELENLEVVEQWVSAAGQRDAVAAQLMALKYQRSQNKPQADEAGAQKEEVQKQLVMLEEIVDQKREDIDRLTLTAPVAGYVFPDTLKSGTPEIEGLLPTWAGTPFEKENRGAYLQASETFCQIGNPKKMEAILVIDQSDRNFIAEGQFVEIKLDHLPTQTFDSTIHKIATEHMEESPARLSAEANYDVITETDEAGRQRPMEISYQARVLLDDDESILRIGLRGHAKIHAAPRTLWSRIWRLLSETFSFHL